MVIKVGLVPLHHGGLVLGSPSWIPKNARFAVSVRGSSSAPRNFNLIMGRKRDKRRTTKRSEKKTKADWKHEETIEVLAWLDYTHGKKRLPKSFEGPVATFESSVVTHLKTCDMSFTLAQVDRKLRRLWNHFKSAEATDKDEIYNSGTACLDLPDDFRKELNLRVNTLRDRSLADALSQSRQLRSTSRTTEQGAHITLDEVATSTPRKRLRDAQSISATSEQSRSRKKTKYSAQGLTTFTIQVPPKEEDINDSLPRLSTPCVVANSQEERTDDDGCDTPTGRSISRHRAGSMLSVLTLAEDRKVPSQDEAGWSREVQESEDPQDVYNEKRCRDLQTQLDDMNQKHEDAITFHNNQLSRCKRNCEDLQRQVDYLENIELSRCDVSSIVKANIAQHRQIMELEELLEDKSWLRTFSSLSAADSLRPSISDARKEMSMIDSGIEQILYGYEDQKLLEETNLDGRDDLKTLVRRSFGRDVLESINFSSVGLRSSTLSFRAVARSLIASSLCQWVFEPSLNIISAKPCALLEKYRQHLARQDSEIAVRNLDFAAHKSLVNGDFIQQHVIPRKAEALADRLSHALAPLFITEQRPSGPHSNASKVWSKKRSKLTEIFDRAIRLKASMMVGKDLFEMVLYPPGTPFDKAVMETETMEGDRAELSAHKELEVVLCLLPSFHVYDDDRKLVEPNNFVKRDSSQRQTAHKLTKAVVVVDG